MHDPLRHPNYSVRTGQNKILIDYRLSASDWAQCLFHTAFGVGLIFFPLFLISSAKQMEWKINTILILVFFAVIMVWGAYKLLIGLEFMLLPARAVIVIDKTNRLLVSKRSFFRKSSFPFDEILSLRLSAEDLNVQALHRGSVRSRRLYCHHLQVQLVNGAVKNLHTFRTRSFTIPLFFEKETFEVRTISKQISKLVASEVGKKYAWLGKRSRD